MIMWVGGRQESGYDAGGGPPAPLSRSYGDLGGSHRIADPDVMRHHFGGDLFHRHHSDDSAISAGHSDAGTPALSANTGEYGGCIGGTRTAHAIHHTTQKAASPTITRYCRGTGVDKTATEDRIGGCTRPDRYRTQSLFEMMGFEAKS